MAGFNNQALVILVHIDDDVLMIWKQVHARHVEGDTVDGEGDARPEHWGEEITPNTLHMLLLDFAIIVQATTAYIAGSGH